MPTQSQVEGEAKITISGMFLKNKMWAFFVGFSAWQNAHNVGFLRNVGFPKMRAQKTYGGDGATLTPLFQLK